MRPHSTSEQLVRSLGIFEGSNTNSAKKVATALAGAAAGMKLKGEKMLLEKQQ
jgi:hypothetical protein